MNLAFITVFNPHTHKLYILRHCTDIVYLSTLSMHVLSLKKNTKMLLLRKYIFLRVHILVNSELIVPEFKLLYHALSKLINYLNYCTLRKFDTRKYKKM